MIDADVAARPPRASTVPGWVALVLGNALLGVVGAAAVVLWWATAYGLAARWGWTHPDPTLFEDGLTPWVMLAVAATAIDVVLLRLGNAALRRLVPARPTWRRRLVAAGAHLAVALGLALAYFGGLFT